MNVRNIKESTCNVDIFKGKARELYGNLHKEDFDVSMSHFLNDLGIDSPIEQIFFIALRLQCQEMEFDFKVNEDINNPGFRFTLSVLPQQKIGKYKVDFLIKIQQGTSRSELIVELDGHNFHDKDKHQRSYEKARDRFLLQHGYKVFHYTGSDVVKSPQHVAYEVMQSLGAIYCQGKSLEEYDADNRLGWENA